MEILYTFPPPFRGMVLAVVPTAAGWLALTDRGWLARAEGSAPVDLEQFWPDCYIRSQARTPDRLLLGGDQGTRLYTWPDMGLLADLPALSGGAVAVGAGQLVAAGRGNIAGLGPDGECRWTVSLKAHIYGLSIGSGWLCGAYHDRGFKSWPLQPDGTPKKRAAGRVDGLPVSLAAGAGGVWAGHAQTGRLDRLTADAATCLGSAQIGRAQQISYTAVGGRGYVVGSGQRRAWVVDAETLTEVASVPVTPTFTDEVVNPCLDDAGTLWFGCDNAVVRVPGLVSAG
jgi:hypothetical protein